MKGVEPSGRTLAATCARFLVKGALRLLFRDRTAHLPSLFFDFLEGPYERLVYGERVHHREAPQALCVNRADVAVLYYHFALRYTRIFPSDFELVTLDGSGRAEPTPSAENIATDYRVGLVGDGGNWGEALFDFLGGSEIAALYERHGLRPAVS